MLKDKVQVCRSQVKIKKVQIVNAIHRGANTQTLRVFFSHDILLYQGF